MNLHTWYRSHHRQIFLVHLAMMIINVSQKMLKLTLNLFIYLYNLLCIMYIYKQTCPFAYFLSHTYLPFYVSTGLLLSRYSAAFSLSPFRSISLPFSQSLSRTHTYCHSHTFSPHSLGFIRPVRRTAYLRVAHNLARRLIIRLALIKFKLYI